MIRSNRMFRLFLWLAVSGGLATTVSGEPDTTWPTNTYWKALAVDSSIYSDNPYRVTLFNPQNGEDGERVWSQTKSVFFYGLGVVGVLVALPESATGWDPESDIFGKWANNVLRDGPEWDRNNWAYNYLGHTYCGGAYYQVARKAGYRQWDSFVYSLMMSTFYWECGVEAFAERPSVQDLVVTPLMGWVYGEWSYKTEMKIRERNNEVLNSKILGGISLFFLDPIDMLGTGVNRVVGRQWIKAGYGYFTYTATPDERETDHTILLNMVFPIGIPDGAAGPSEGKVLRYEDLHDPVDTGIIGFSLGQGSMLLDDKWAVDDCRCIKSTLGLYFTPRFSSRLAYAKGEMDGDVAGEDITYENYSLDFQYYFNAEQTLRPYVTGGFGDVIWEKDHNEESFQWNAGVGLHWQFHRKWALQSEWISYLNPSKERHDQNVSASLIYRFGDGEHHDW